MTRGDVDARKVAEFLVLAFAFSWSGGLVLSVADVDALTLRGTVVAVALYMWGPAAAAAVVLGRRGESLRERCGFRRGRIRWVVLAWVAPVGVVLAGVVVGAAIPGVSVTGDDGGSLTELGPVQREVDAGLPAPPTLPVPPVAAYLVRGLAAGLTVNAAAALGEELGWRGLLLDELSPLGFWRLSTFTGVVWGLWHAPLVVLGFNFPGTPVAGVAVMTAATLSFSPTFAYLTARSGTVLSAAFLHGSFNGLGTLSLVYLTGADVLVTSPVGVVGVAAGVLATVACVVHDRLVAAEPITTGGPVSPWT